MTEESFTEQARALFAKSRNKQGEWLPLWRHLDDAGEVGVALLEQWAPPAAVDWLCSELGCSRGQLTAVVGFLAGVHDIGKASAVFATYDRELLKGLEGLGLPPAPAASTGHHTVLGKELLRSWLAKRGWERRTAGSFAAVVEWHHGYRAPSEPSFRAGGGQAWEAAADSLLTRQFLRWNPPEVRLTQPAQLVLAGLVTMADWIASNERYFPFREFDDPRRVFEALTRFGLPKPWRPLDVPPVEWHYQRRFPHISAPRKAQVAVLESVLGMGAPGLLLIEAPMGLGKTESALVAAEIMAARWGCGGVHVALPTRAVTDAMFSRVMAWQQTLPSGEISETTIRLGHGKATLNPEFAALPRRAVDLDGAHPESATVHEWFGGRHRGTLSAFNVTTIDQLLSAAVAQHHSALLHLGLVGKIIIIDEVHAYDEWMSSHLESLLVWLARYRVPVILLSATLPPARREALLSTYAGTPIKAAHDGYPLSTTVVGGVVEVRAAEPPPSKTVQVEFADDAQVLGRLVSQAQAGANVLVIRNTVKRAVALADALAEFLPADMVRLNHSRFLAIDRQANDVALLDEFGPPSRLSERGGTRPQGVVVVATQVAEQSLDVDFDLLVTDLAPVDLVLQRIGRLHRHDRPRPAGFEEPRCLIVGCPESPDAAAELGAIDGRPYALWPLLAAADVLRGRERLDIPRDIPVLVADAYDEERRFPSGWEDLAASALASVLRLRSQHRSRAGSHQLALPGSSRLVRNLFTGVQSMAGALNFVRLPGDISLEICLVEEVEGAWRIPSWIDHPRAGWPVDPAVVPDEASRDALLRCAVSVPLYGGNVSAVENELLRQTPEAWKAAHLRAVVVPLVEGECLVGGRTFSYAPRRGLLPRPRS